MIRILLPSLLLASLAACGGEPQGKSTTKLDAVEVQPGTISDSMIILDDAASDGTAVDNSVPEDESAKDASKPSEETDEETPSDDEAEEGEAINAPVATKAAPATSKGE